MQLLTSLSSTIRGQSDVAPGDLHAGGHALHVPLPGSWQRLVEVVRTEDHPSVGHSEATEVGDVRVATGLDVDPRRRSGRQICRHDGSCASIEGERGHQHPAVADRHQLLHPAGRLGGENRHRVLPVAGWGPVAVHRARRQVTSRPAPRGGLAGLKRCVPRGHVRQPRPTDLPVARDPTFVVRTRAGAPRDR